MTFLKAERSCSVSFLYRICICEHMMEQNTSRQKLDMLCAFCTSLIGFNELDLSKHFLYLPYEYCGCYGELFPGFGGESGRSNHLLLSVNPVVLLVWYPLLPVGIWKELLGVSERVGTGLG